MAGRSDEAIHLRPCDAERWIASLALAMTMMEHSYLRRHCEERKRRSNPSSTLAMPSHGLLLWSLSSGAHPRNPVARN